MNNVTITPRRTGVQHARRTLLSCLAAVVVGASAPPVMAKGDNFEAEVTVNSTIGKCGFTVTPPTAAEFTAEYNYNGDTNPPEVTLAATDMTTKYIRVEATGGRACRVPLLIVEFPQKGEPFVAAPLPGSRPGVWRFIPVIGAARGYTAASGEASETCIGTFPPHQFGNRCFTPTSEGKSTYDAGGRALITRTQSKPISTYHLNAKSYKVGENAGSTDSDMLQSPVNSVVIDIGVSIFRLEAGARDSADATTYNDTLVSDQDVIPLQFVVNVNSA